VVVEPAQAPHQGGKRYLVDTAAAAAAADVDEQEVVCDGNLRGRWFDAFATMQMRAEMAASSPRRPTYHLRLEVSRREVDLMVDLGRGRRFGIEFTTGSTPTRQDARCDGQHLRRSAC
jgi:hypothetical protein